MPATVSIWEKDPALNRRTTDAIPKLNNQPLAFHFIPGALGFSDNIATAEFRYWNAASTLRRAADFWAASAQPPAKWHGGQVLDVYVDRGVALQSEYDGQSLSFYHGSPAAHPNVVVYSGESPDLLCHELGHAILDAIRPELYSRPDLETKAFAETFGDMSAILCALQVPTFVSALPAETGNNFWSNSSLSRIAQQFGDALRLEKPNDTDPDCLRNAWNDHLYRDPANLDHSAPPGEVAANAHSFSRILTGALYEALAGMVKTKAGNAIPTPDNLQQVSRDMRDILVDGARTVPIVPQFFYASIAATMVEASARCKPVYRDVFRDAFIRREILQTTFV